MLALCFYFRFPSRTQQDILPDQNLRQTILILINNKMMFNEWAASVNSNLRLLLNLFKDLDQLAKIYLEIESFMESCFH